MGARAIFIQRQRCIAGVGAQDARLNVPQQFALGIGRQAPGLADADRDITRCEQIGDAPVIDVLHHEHHVRRFLAQRTQQRRQQAELDVIGQTDAKGHGAHGRIEIAGQTQRDRQ
ncbi:hypothetical protein D3C78_1341600 [compost metagenome]